MSSSEVDEKIRKSTTTNNNVLVVVIERLYAHKNNFAVLGLMVAHLMVTIESMSRRKYSVQHEL